MSNDLLYYGIILFIFFIILGLYLSQESPLNINQKNQILMENFVSESSTTSQKKGASQFTNGDYPKIIAMKPLNQKVVPKKMIYHLLHLNQLSHHVIKKKLLVTKKIIKIVKILIFYPIKILINMF